MNHNAAHGMIIAILWLETGLTDTRRISNEEESLREAMEPYMTVKGMWPFNATSKCNEINTRDTAYHYTKTDFELPRVENCGLNRFSNERDLEDSVPKSRDSSFKDWLREYISISTQDNRYRRSLEKQESLGNRIVGGESVESGEWPWLVAIGANARGPKCGATLIADRWLVTAAHCFNDYERPCDYNARLGSTNWMVDKEGYHVDRQIEAIYRHPDYDKEKSKNDIALLKLAQPVTLDPNSYINVICLPDSARSVPTGTVCKAAGWGRLGEDRPKKMNFEAMEVGLPVMAYEGGPCGKYSSDTIHKGMLCAGYSNGERDTCQGDSGGPLAYRKDGRWTQLGLTSFGVGCARAGNPGVYTDVGQFTHWIASIIRRYS